VESLNAFIPRCRSLEVFSFSGSALVSVFKPFGKTSMLKNILLTAVAICAPLSFANSAEELQQVVVENFASDPVARDWESFGDADLLHWNRDDENLAVTWDSSRPNSYFRLPLGTIMTRRDDFDVSLDLFLNDFAAGVNSEKPGTLQLAFGFQNRADASKTNFFRAVPNAAPNLVEFNFMPDTGFGPTIWPAVMSTNGAMNYSGASDFSVFNLPTGQWMQISFVYRGSNETATISVKADGELVGPITIAHLATNDVAFGKKFTQFKVDAFAIASYSDDGQSGPFSGSLLAHGMVDNVVVTFPSPPIRNLTGRFQNGAWAVSLLSRTNWNYQLQVSDELRSWTSIGDGANGSGDTIQLNDTSFRSAGFYRVAAQPLD
jgi:hypothetical protein